MRLEQKRQAGLKPEQIHTTRMMPKRVDALLDGGSLYWVTKGVILSRQRILELRPITDNEGVKRCEIVLEPTLVLTRPQPRRPFQGWRYLRDADAPVDLSRGGDGAAEDMPMDMRRDLMELGLI